MSPFLLSQGNLDIRLVTLLMSPKHPFYISNNFQKTVGTPAEIAQANGLHIQPAVAPTNDGIELYQIEDAGYSVGTMADGMQLSGGLGELFGAAENLAHDIRESIEGPQHSQTAIEAAPSIDPTPAPVAPVYNHQPSGMGA